MSCWASEENESFREKISNVGAMTRTVWVPVGTLEIKKAPRVSVIAERPAIETVAPPMTRADRLSRTMPCTVTGAEVIDPLPAHAMTTGIASAKASFELHFIPPEILRRDYERKNGWKEKVVQPV